MCVSDELYGLCKRTAITKRRMSNNVRSRVSYVIKPSMHLDGESRMALLCFALSCLAFVFASAIEISNIMLLHMVDGSEYGSSVLVSTRAHWTRINIRMHFGYNEKKSLSHTT